MARFDHALKIMFITFGVLGVAEAEEHYHRLVEFLGGVLKQLVFHCLP